MLFSWVDRRYRKLRPVKPRFRKVALKTRPIRVNGREAATTPNKDYRNRVAGDLTTGSADVTFADATGGRGVGPDRTDWLKA